MPGRDGAHRFDSELDRVRRTLGERLETVAAPHVARSILDEAQSRAGLSVLPRGGPELVDFVRGALFRQIVTTVGREAAEVVLDDLAPFLRSPSGEEITHVRERERSEVEPVALPVAPARAPVRGGAHLEQETSRPVGVESFYAVVASADPRRRIDFAKALGGASIVLQVEDVMDLVDLLQAATEGVPLVVLDGSAPAVHPATVAAMLPELPSDVRVILWGFDRETERAVAALSKHAADWLILPGEVTPRDLAVLLGAHGPR